MKQYLILSVLLTLGAITSLAGSASLPPMFDPPNERGGLVMGFYIESVAPDSDGNVVLTVAALDGKQRAAFQVIVEKQWSFGRPFPGSPAKKERIPDGGSLVIKSVGPATEVFARAYAKACKIKVKKYDFGEFRFKALSSDSDPRKLAKETVRLFLYQGALGAEEYFTIYCAIDIPERTFMLYELLGPQSHAALVRVFTGVRRNKDSELK